MSVHPFPRPPRLPVQPVDRYFSVEPSPQPPISLKPLTALEQMFAYYGSDRD